MGVEIAVGYAFAWLVGKARRVAGRADAEVDRGLDAGMDRLHELISVKLGDDPALERAQEEAESGLEEPSERTRQRLELALEDAVEHDPVFARALGDLVRQLQMAACGEVSASGDGLAVGGSVDIRAAHSSAAAMSMGNVTIGSTGNPQQPGREQG